MFDWVDYLLAWVKSLFLWVGDFFSNFGDFLYNFFWDIALEFVAWIDSLLLPLVEALPDLYIGDSELFKVFLFFNAWIPFDYAGILLSAYLTFYLSVIFIKWLLGLIPGIN